MKKRLRLFLLSTLLSVAALSGLTAHAAEGTPPLLQIRGCSLSLMDSIHLLYAVEAEGAEASDVRLLIWTAPQETYTRGTEDAVLTPDDPDASLLIFRYTDLAAKQMTDEIYARACVETDGQTYYSDVVKYSILQYAYNKMGKTSTAGETELILLLEHMLSYGAAAQQYFDYRTDRLATDHFYQIKLNGGVLTDGCTQGLFLTGDRVTLTAPETDGAGAPFSHWADADGNAISTESVATVTVATANATYTAVYGTPAPQPPAEEPNENATLSELRLLLTDDLRALRARLDPALGTAADLYLANRGEALAYKEGHFANTETFARLTDEIDALIDLIGQATARGYVDTEVSITVPDDPRYGEANQCRPLYYLNADAKAYVEETGLTEQALLADLQAAVTESTVTDSSYLTVRKTAYPLTYTLTREEQACLDLYTCYHALYADIHATVQALNGNITRTQTRITQDSAYQAILDSLCDNTALLAEVEAVTASFTEAIASDAKVENAMASGWTASVTRRDALGERHITVDGSTLTHAADYREDGILLHIEPHVTAFEDKFYTDAAKTASTVVNLSIHRENAVDFIAQTLHSYKNTYADNGSGDLIPVASGRGYAYDMGVSVKSDRAVAYEAELDRLLAEYTERIMSVKLNTRTEVTNHLGESLLTPIADGAWSIDSARAAVNACVVDLLGYETVAASDRSFSDGVTPRGPHTATVGGVLYREVESRVFLAYKTAYLRSYVDITPTAFS